MVRRIEIALIALVIVIAALSTGAAQGCVDESLRYAREREAFGAAIGTYQGIQFKIAEMESRTVCARLAWQDAAAKMSAGVPFKKEAAIAKLVSSNASAYEYLNESIQAWPDQETLASWLREAGFASVEHRNLTAGIVALHRGVKPAGRHAARFDADGLASGVYVVRLETDGAAVTRRIVLAR